MIRGKREGRGKREAGSGWARPLFRLIIVGLLALPVSLPAQQDPKLRAQRDTLDKLRREREELERRAAELQASVHDLNEEVTNLDRRADATARIVRALDEQLASITKEIELSTGKVKESEEQLESKKAALHGRLVDIYKRGPLFGTQAMLSARSFGELVSRYKYLHLLAVRDRALVSHVQTLHEQVRQERDNLIGLQQSIEMNRSDKRREEARLRSLERERESSLASTRRQAKQLDDRLDRIKATELQLTSAITVLETERRRTESARPATARATSTIKTTDYGRLDWPVDGSLIYTFGKAQTASNATIRWDGVGIKANVGTAVQAVAPGRVVSVGQLGTYGLTVIVDHGGGDYSIYGSLYRADVRAQQSIAKGQTLGTVGVSDPDQPAHLHFEIRHGTDGRPMAVDPAKWLKEQR